jgi:membrane protein YdbS with pleckstrin-like domain
MPTPKYFSQIAHSKMPFPEKVFLLIFLTQLTIFLVITAYFAIVMFGLGLGNWQPPYASEIFACLTILFFLMLCYFYWLFVRFKKKIKRVYEIDDKGEFIE